MQSYLVIVFAKRALCLTTITMQAIFQRVASEVFHILYGYVRQQEIRVKFISKVPAIIWLNIEETNKKGGGKKAYQLY